MSTSELHTTRIILVILAAAITTRVAMALWLPQEIIWPDGARYENVALNLVEGKGFGDIADNRLSVPTQPLLIAAAYSIFGKSYLALRLVSAAIGAASCVVGFLLARSLFGVTAGIFAGLILALYPHLVYLSALFEYPQTLAIFLISLFLLLCLKFAENDRTATLFVASLLLGAIILTLPSLLLFAPVFLLLLIKRANTLPQNAVRVVVAIAGLTLTIGPWAYRNYLEYGEVMLVNAAGGANFWAANNETYARYGKKGVVPVCAAGYEATTYCREHRTVIAELRRSALSREQKVFEHERLAWEHGLRFVRDSPLEFAALSVRKFIQLWSPWPDAVHTGPARGGSSRDLISALAYIPLLVLACAGVILSVRQHARRLLPVYAFMLMFVAPFAVYLPTMRYRLPIDFLLAIFAAVPLALTWQRIAARRAKGQKALQTIVSTA